MADITKTINDAIKSAFSEYKDALLTNVSGDAIYKTMVDLDEKAHDIAKSFGQGAEAISGLKVAMAGAVTSVELLGGTFANIAEIQQGVGEALGRNVLLNSQAYEKLFAAEKVSGKTAKEIVDSFKDAGFAAYDAGKQMETVINSARQIGANAVAVSKQVLENTESMNRYNFVGGVEGLSKMAAQAVSLRVDMSKTLEFADKVFNPEGAIEMAAAMQRLGVAQSDLLDPLRLMDLSANDPTELQNQIVQMTQQFVQLNKNGQFEIMPGAKRQFYEISKAMNIPYETLTKMAIGSKDLDEKMKKISFPSSIASEEDKKMIANMAEFNKGTGKFEVSFSDDKGNLVTKDVTKLSETDRDLLKKGFEPKTLEQLTKEQLSYQKDIAANMRAVAHQGGFGFAASKTGQQLYGLKKDATQAFAGTFVNDATSSKRLTEGINNSMGPVMESFKDMLAGKKSPQDALNALATAAKKASGYVGELGTETIKAGGKAGQKMLMSENDFTQMLGIVLQKLVNVENQKSTTAKNTETIPVQDFMINGKNLVTNPADTIFGGTGAERFFESVNKLTSGNNNMGMMENPTQNMNSTMDINFNLKLDSNQNIDMAQLERAFNSTALKEKIIEVATLGMDRFSSEASVRKKMNPYVKSITG
jgi:hypothetical protein